MDQNQNWRVRRGSRTFVSGLTELEAHYYAAGMNDAAVWMVERGLVERGEIAHAWAEEDGPDERDVDPTSDPATLARMEADRDEWERRADMGIDRGVR